MSPCRIHALINSTVSLSAIAVLYVKTMSSTNTDTDISYTRLSAQVQDALEELSGDNQQDECHDDVNDIFKLENAVQIFFVASDGRVSTVSGPQTLRIFQFSQESDDCTYTVLQVGDWTHALLSGASPCLLAENGAFMFPVLYSDLPDNSVGLVLLDSVSKQDRAELLAILEEHTALKSHTQLPPEQQLGAIGSAIVRGAEYLSQGIEAGAEKAGDLIEQVTEISQEKLAKAEEDAKVGSITKGSINAAKSATTVTVKATGYVADKAGKLTKSVADYLAAKVEKPVGSLVNKSGGDKKKGSALALVVDAARGSLIAYGTVYNGLETNAKVLGKNLKENSVKVMSHKYGGEAGSVWGDAMTATGNAAMTYMNISSLGVKGLVKKTAKETGKNVAKNALLDKPKESIKDQEGLQQND